MKLGAAERDLIVQKILAPRREQVVRLEIERTMKGRDAGIALIGRSTYDSIPSYMMETYSPFYGRYYGDFDVKGLGDTYYTLRNGKVLKDQASLCFTVNLPAYYRNRGDGIHKRVLEIGHEMGFCDLDPYWTKGDFSFPRINRAVDIRSLNMKRDQAIEILKPSLDALDKLVGMEDEINRLEKSVHATLSKYRTVGSLIANWKEIEPIVETALGIEKGKVAPDEEVRPAVAELNKALGL